MPGGRQKAKVKGKARAKPAQAQSKPVAQPESHKPVDYSRFEDIQVSDDENEQEEQLLPAHPSEGHAGAARATMPPSGQSLREHTEDEADDDDIDVDTDEDSYSEDSEVWVPTKTSQQPGSSAAGQNTARTQPAPTKPVAAKNAATKAAASKFGFKAGFLTGGKANGAASNGASSTCKTEPGNEIKDVSDEDTDEYLDTDNEAPTGGPAGSRAAKGPTGVQPLPCGKYTRAELASFEDSDAPPSLHSSEEPVTRMFYSDMDFASAKPANRGTASGCYASHQKAPEAGSAASVTGGGNGDIRTRRASQSSGAAAKSTQPAGYTASKARPAPDKVKYSPDQKRVAAAVMTMLNSARRTLHPAAEQVLRLNFGMHHPDTGPFLDMVPKSGELPSLAALLDVAGSSVLDGLERIAKLCIRSGMRALELFQKDCAFERMPDDTEVIEAVMQVDPPPARDLLVASEGWDVSHDLIPSNEIRPDLAMLMSFVRRKVAKEKVNKQQKYIEFYDCIIPGVAELFSLKDTLAVPGYLVAQLSSALRAHRAEAAKQAPCCSKDPIEHLFQFLIMSSAGDLENDEDTEILFDLLMATVPHLDKPIVFRGEEGATAQGSAAAWVKAAAPAGPQTPADSARAGGRPAGGRNGGVAPKAASPAAPHVPIRLEGVFVSFLLKTSPPGLEYFTLMQDSTYVQDWVKDLGIKRDPRWAAAMAMVAMIETRDLVCDEGGRISKDKPVSQNDMSAFIEDLVPGVHNVTQSSAWQKGLDPGLGGMDFVAAHFVKITKAYRSQTALCKRPHSELFDAKLARSPRLAEMRKVRRFVRAMEVASSPLVAACGGRLQHPACLLKVEMPPPSAASSELEDDHPTLYAAFETILSVFLESTNLTQTSDRLKAVLPGMEDVMREVADAELRPGWLMRCAFHLLSIVANFKKEAETQEQTLRQYMYHRAAKAKLPDSEQLVEELLDKLITLPSAITPALLAVKEQQSGGGSKGLSARQQQLLALEGSAYTLRWVGGEPIIIQDTARPRKLTREEETFIAQYARDAMAAQQPRKAAAAAPEKPMAQASSRGPAGSKKAPAPRGTSGATAKGAGRPLRDDSPDSRPDLVFDPELEGTSAAAPVGPKAKPPSKEPGLLSVSPNFPKGQQIAEQLLRGREKESSATVEEDTIAEVDSNSDSDEDLPDSHAPRTERPVSTPLSDYPGYDMPYPAYPADPWLEPRLPKGVPEAERTRLREVMMKRREEQDARALQEKLAASQAQQQEAAKQEAERKKEEQRQKLVQKLIDEEEAAKKKVARQAEARQKMKAKRAKQRGMKQQKAPTKEASSDSEQGAEEEGPGTQDSTGQEAHEHDLAAFAGLRVSDSSASTKGAARGKAEGKQAPAKAQSKLALEKAQKPEQPKQAAAPGKERVDGEAAQRGPAKAMTAFGNVPRSSAPGAPQGRTASAAQQPLPPGKAPPLAPASEMLRELGAAMDNRDVDRLEEAISKGDSWAKQAPINHFMTPVRQKLKQARGLQRRQLPTGPAPLHQAPRANVQQPGASAFPAAVQALFQRPSSLGHMPPPPPQQQRPPVQLPVPVQVAAPRAASPAPIPPHLQHIHTPHQAPHVRPYQPPVPIPMPAPAGSRAQVPSTAQRVIPPARHGAKVAEMSQEWQAALQHKVGNVSMPGAQQGSEEHEEDELCVVCWDRPREVIFLGCGHMCACRACAADIMHEECRALCPMCRAKIISTIMAKF